MTIKFTKQKVVISGDILEIYAFEKSVYYDFEGQDTSLSRGKNKTEEEKKDILSRSLQRTRKKLTRLINSNSRHWFDESGNPYQPKFTTFTFKENITDITEANHLYTAFLKRFNYERTGEKSNHLKYAAVPEFQKRGAVHYHAAFFNLPFIENTQLAHLWSHGFVRINEIDTRGNVGLYMTKYMSKGALDKRLWGKRRYFASQNLHTPIVVRDPSLAARIISQTAFVPPTYYNEFETDHQGHTSYTALNLVNFPEIKELVLKSL